MDKGIYLPYSTRALSTPIIISLWIYCLVCLACLKIFRISLLSILKNDLIFLSWLVVFCICGYYVNKIFLFKNDKYEKYFAEFDKKKRNISPSSIKRKGICSTTASMSFPSLSGGRLSICCLAGGEGGAETNGGNSMPCGISGGKRNSRTGATGYLYGFIEQ